VTLFCSSGPALPPPPDSILEYSSLSLTAIVSFSPFFLSVDMILPSFLRSTVTPRRTIPLLEVFGGGPYFSSLPLYFCTNLYIFFSGNGAGASTKPLHPGAMPQSSWARTHFPSPAAGSPACLRTDATLPLGTLMSPAPKAPKKGDSLCRTLT